MSPLIPSPVPSESDCNHSQSSLEAEFVNAEQISAFLKINTQTVRNLTSNGKLPYYKFGKRVLYRIDEIRELILKNKRGNQSGDKI